MRSVASRVASLISTVPAPSTPVPPPPRQQRFLRTPSTSSPPRGVDVSSNRATGLRCRLSARLVDTLLHELDDVAALGSRRDALARGGGRGARVVADLVPTSFAPDRALRRRIEPRFRFTVCRPIPATLVRRTAGGSAPRPGRSTPGRATRPRPGPDRSGAAPIRAAPRRGTGQHVAPGCSAVARSRRNTPPKSRRCAAP